MDETHTRLLKASILAIGFILGFSICYVTDSGPKQQQSTGSQDRIWQSEIWNTSYLLENSDLVVKGTVTGINDAEWDTDDGSRPEELGNHRIYHTVNIDVEETLMGEREEKISLRVSGGTVGNMTMNSEDAPSFVEGDQAIIFIEKEDGHYEVFGASHGVFYLSGDEAIRRKAPAKYRSVELSQLKSSVKNQQ